MLNCSPVCSESSTPAGRRNISNFRWKRRFLEIVLLLDAIGSIRNIAVDGMGHNTMLKACKFLKVLNYNAMTLTGSRKLKVEKYSKATQFVELLVQGCELVKSSSTNIVIPAIICVLVELVEAIRRWGFRCYCVRRHSYVNIQ